MCRERVSGPFDEICCECRVEGVFCVVGWGVGVVELDDAGVGWWWRGSGPIASNWGTLRNR